MPDVSVDGYLVAIWLDAYDENLIGATLLLVLDHLACRLTQLQDEDG